MRLPLAFLAMLGFVLSTLLGAAPTTRAGVQCPTAAVQTVTVRDCCGRLVTRAPRPGERTFVQCQCAEKRQSALKVAASPRNDALPPARFTLDLPQVPERTWVEHSYAIGLTSHVDAPAVRPPTLS